MKALERFLSKWLLPFAKVLESKTQMKAVRQGMMALVPITLVGAVPVLFQQLGGIPKLPSWIAAVSNYINNITSPIYFATFGLMSVYVAVFVAYYYAKERNLWDIGAIVTALMSFVVVAVRPLESGGSDVAYLAGEGIFVALVISLLSVEILHIFKNKLKFTINLGQGVPTPILRSFENLWPILFSVLIIAILSFGIETLSGIRVVELIQTLFSPLTSLVNTLPGIMLIIFIQQLLWWFGIHGYSVMAPVWLSVAFQNVDANAAALAKGEPLSSMLIFTPDFMWSIVGVTGAGVTGALVVIMMFSKSKRYKTLGRLALIPTFFSINEPVMFGVPIVLNPRFFIPMMLAPQIAALIGWFSIKLGLMNPFTMVSPYVPVPIGAIVASFDWRYVIVLGLILVCSALIYYPFFKIAEKEAILQETSGDQEASLDDFDF
ncbi:PTS sugar transporter subunit IIC [Listeria monocytogenes]|nr:PTS sugar transporter subunit IIC [Listeria monocytogenes]